MEENINTANLEVVATNDSVTLNWDKIPDENGVYEIYKDDVQIGSTRGLEFTDKNVKPNSRYQYDIVATTQVSDEQKEKYL
ncbi:fibronectin type III domain-containing protein, partial [Priestia megaterium]